MKRRSPTPTLYEIARFWSRVDRMRYRRGLSSLYPSNLVDPGEPSCAACGWRIPLADDLPASEPTKQGWARSRRWLDRAHLVDHMLGGSTRRANLIPLCYLCHRRMPMFRSRSAALTWIRNEPHCRWWWQLATERDSPLYPEDRHDLRSHWLVAADDLARQRLPLAWEWSFDEPDGAA